MELHGRATHQEALGDIEIASIANSRGATVKGVLQVGNVAGYLTDLGVGYDRAIIQLDAVQDDDFVLQYPALPSRLY